MLLGPLAGSVADRFDRRQGAARHPVADGVGRTRRCGRRGRAGCAAPSPSSPSSPSAASSPGINIPSWQSFVNDLVPRKDLLSAVTLNSLQFNAARALGPGIAGVLLASLGASWAFFLNGVSFLFVLVALLLVRNRQEARATALSGGFLRQFRRAMAYTRRQPGHPRRHRRRRARRLRSATRCSSSPSIFAAEVYEVGPIGLVVAERVARVGRGAGGAAGERVEPRAAPPSSATACSPTGWRSSPSPSRPCTSSGSWR